MASTIRDVAEFSGFSLGTISKYINGIPVKEKTRLKIEEAIKTLNYKPNTIAKGLRNARSYTIGVIIPKLGSVFNSTIISALENYLLPFGYSVIVSEHHNNENMEIEKIKFLLHQMVDGIVIAPNSMSGKYMEIIKESRVPFVVIDQILKRHKTDCVILNNSHATERPTEALIKMGHRDIAIIAGNKNFFSYTAAGRFAGYKKAMDRYGIPIQHQYVYEGGYSMEGGYAAVLSFFSNKKPPTAMIVSNHDMTIGAVLAIYYLRKTIPDDISFVGFDNLPPVNVIKPPLSIINQPMKEMGYSAGSLLFKRINGDYSDFPKKIIHEAELTLTESVRPFQKRQSQRGCPRRKILDSPFFNFPNP